MKSKYLKRAHINEIKFRELLKFIGLIRAYSHNIIQKIRHRIHEFSLKENPLFGGDVEADKLYYFSLESI